MSEAQRSKKVTGVSKVSRVSKVTKVLTGEVTSSPNLETHLITQSLSHLITLKVKTLAITGFTGGGGKTFKAC